MSSADGSKRILRLIIAQESGFYNTSARDRSTVCGSELDADISGSYHFSCIHGRWGDRECGRRRALATVHRLFIIVSCLCATIGKEASHGILLVVNVTLIGIGRRSFVAFADSGGDYAIKDTNPHSSHRVVRGKLTAVVATHLHSYPTNTH